MLPENHEFRHIDAMPLHFLLEPSHDEARRVHVNVLLQFSRGHIIDDASRLCSLHPTTVCTDRDPPKFYKA